MSAESNGTGDRRVLVVEDEPDLRDLLTYNLTAAGFTVKATETGAEGLEAVTRFAPDVVLLDLMLPDIPGTKVCRRIRGGEAGSRQPAVMMLTAKGEEIDRVVGFELGADDYVTKPFSPRELVARVRAVLRRADAGEETRQPHEVYERGRLRLDFDTYELFLDGRPVPLSLREFELLKFFVRHPHRVYDRLQLLDLVWGPDMHVEPRTVDVHVRRLRKRVERDDADPKIILTVRGVGYKFNPDALES